MTKMLLLSASLLLMSCNSGQFQADDNRTKSDNSAADTSSRVTAPAMSLLNTTWEFSDDGKPTVITIDKAGDYIENRVDGRHVVHGTYVQKNGKDCFTSAMGDQATSCWTTIPNVKIGATASAKSDEGYTAVFKRVDYRVLQLPS